MFYENYYYTSVLVYGNLIQNKCFNSKETFLFLNDLILMVVGSKFDNLKGPRYTCYSINVSGYTHT